MDDIFPLAAWGTSLMFTVEQVKSLNELELKVYQYIIQHKAAVPYMKIRELASEAHVSTSTILRFCKKLDCYGYTEFKYKLKQYVGQKNTVQVPDDLDELRTFLGRLENPAYQKQLDEAVGIIARADRVICVGICNSGYAAEHAARYFTSFGKFSLPITDPYYPVHQLDEKINTVAVIFSVSGESYEPVVLANNLKKHGCRIVCISNTDQNTIAKLSDITLPYFINQRRIGGDSDMETEDIDFTSQAPAVILAELLGKRLAGRLKEE